jgi:uncharacterized RDD family membrane protein YckC
MSSVPQGNRFAPPSAHVEDVTTQGVVQLAGRGARFGGSLIDGLLMLGVFWLVGLVTPWSPFEAAAKGGFGAGLLINGVLGIVVFAIIHGYLLATRGQTLGKLLLGLRIVRSDGQRASLARLLGLRYGIGWLINGMAFIGPLYSLVDCLLIFRASHKCLHDNIADTIVVKA